MGRNIVPCEKSRKYEAEETYYEAETKANILPSEFVGIVKEMLDAVKIDGIVELVSADNLKARYKDFEDNYDWFDKANVLFIQFVKNKENRYYAAVLGAGGNDIKFARNDNRGCWRIIGHIDGIQWDKENILLILPKDISSRGISSNGKSVDNILKCRNGVEHYVGKCLEDKEIPILNKYSHHNYSENYWEKVKNREYKI